MTADHLLHVAPEPGWLRLYLTCIPDVGEHYTLWESDCTCECEMCTGDDPDHWGCDRQEHGYSLDGAAPCQSRLDAEHCWVHSMDVPLSECLSGEFPKDAAPWPVVVRYLGDGEIEIEYAGVEQYERRLQKLIVSAVDGTRTNKHGIVVDYAPQFDESDAGQVTP